MTADVSVPAPQPQRDDPHELRRVITRPMLIFFILGDILGAGIYSLTGQVGAEVGGAIWASFLVAFVLAFLTAFAYMELVTKYPQAAGGALYCDRAYQIKFLSFLVTFAIMASGVTSASFAATRVGGRYFSGLTGVEHPPTILIGTLAILLVAAVNFWGVAESIKVNIAITCVELAGLLFVIGVGASVLAQGSGDPSAAFTFSGQGFGVVTGIMAGAATAFYAFLGFEDSVNLAEETTEPSKDFPPAMITGLLAAAVVYLLVAFSAAMVVPLDVLTTSSGPLLEVVKIGAPNLPVSQIFSAVSMVAVSNTMLINMLMASRLLYGMARRDVLPRPFAVLSNRRTPWIAIAFTTALSILLMATVNDLTDLSDTTVLLLTAVFLLVNIAALVLRRDHVRHSHFRAPTVIPVLGAIVSAVFLFPFVREAGIYLLAFWLLLGGVALWAVNRLIVRRTPPRDGSAASPPPL
jgi:amino acid transporter